MLFRSPDVHARPTVGTTDIGSFVDVIARVGARKDGKSLLSSEAVAHVFTRANTTSGSGVWGATVGIYRPTDWPTDRRTTPTDSDGRPRPTPTDDPDGRLRRTTLTDSDGRPRRTTPTDDPDRRLPTISDRRGVGRTEGVSAEPTHAVPDRPSGRTHITDSLSGVAADVRLKQDTRPADGAVGSSPDVPAVEYRCMIGQPSQMPYDHYGLLSYQGRAV